MSQFIADVKVKLDDSELNALKNLKKQVVDVEVNLTGNGAAFVKNINNVFNGVNTAASQAGKNVANTFTQNFTRGISNNSNIISSFEKTLKNIGMTSGEIKGVSQELGKLDIQIDHLGQSLSKTRGKNGKNILNVEVSGIDKLGNAVKFTKQFDDETGQLIRTIQNVSTATEKTSKITDTFINKQKKAVADFKNTVNQVSRNALDKNASKAIKTESRRDAIKAQAQKVRDSITALENANPNDYVDLQVKVEADISDLKILIKEMQNAESTATALRAKPIEVVRDEARKKVEGLRADIEKAGVSSKELDGYLDQLNIPDDVDASGINDFLNILAKAKAELQKLKKQASADKSIEKAQIKASGLIKELNKASIDNDGLKSFKAEINGTEVTLESLVTELKNVKTAGDVSVVSEKWKAFGSAAKEAGVMAEQAVDTASKLKTYMEKYNVNDYSTNQTLMEQKLKNYDGQDTDALKRANAELESYKASLKEVDSLIERMNDPTAQPLTSADYSDMYIHFENMEDSAKRYSNAMKEVNAQSSKTLKDGVATTKSNEILTYYNNNTKAIKKYGQALKDLAEDAKKATTQADLDDINRRFKELKTTISAEGLTGKSFLDDFKRATGQIAQFTGIYGVLQNVMQDIPREMAQQVIKVDDAMTNLRMATSITNKEAQSLMKTYSELGNELKATGVDVATSATEWLKQGKSIQEAQNLAADSIVLSKIGGISSEDATKTITAAMKSYDLAESEVMGFIDKISSIDLVSATDVGGLSQAFNEVAANAKNAGVESEKLLAYAAVIGETSQEGMASVGTSLNAVFSRMGNIKLSRLKDYETGEDLSNVETVLRGVGISLRDSQDQFREFDDVLDETANNWKNYSSVQQRAVAQAFAGTHHMNEFMILMQNWGKVQEYTKTATEASGQSMEKFSAYQESATGKIEGFKNAFQSLSTATLDSNLFKGVIDSGTVLLTLLTEIIDAFGLIPTVASVIGGASFIKNFDKPRKHRVSPKIFSYI